MHRMRVRRDVGTQKCTTSPLDHSHTFLSCLSFSVCLRRTQGLRPSILSKLIFSLRDMVNGPVIAVAIWILGEYCEVNHGEACWCCLIQRALSVCEVNYYSFFF